MKQEVKQLRQELEKQRQQNDSLVANTSALEEAFAGKWRALELKADTLR